MIYTYLFLLAFGILSLLVLRRRPWLSGLGMASALALVYSWDSMGKGASPSVVFVVYALIALIAAGIIALASRARSTIQYGKAWLLLVGYFFFMMLRGILSTSSYVYPVCTFTTWALVLVATRALCTWQAVFWAVGWMLVMNIMLNWFGLPPSPWELPPSYYWVFPYTKFNLGLSLDSWWFVTLGAISLYPLLRKPLRLVWFSGLAAYTIFNLVHYPLRAFVLFLGVLAASLPFLSSHRSLGKSMILSLVIIVSLGLLFSSIVAFIANQGWFRAELVDIFIEKMGRLTRDEVRAMVYTATINYWLENPLIGHGMFTSSKDIWLLTGLGPHSGLLIILADGGVIAGLLFCLGILHLLQQVHPWRAPVVKGALELRYFVFFGVLSLLVQMAGHGLLYNSSILVFLVALGYHIPALIGIAEGLGERNPVLSPTLVPDMRGDKPIISARIHTAAIHEVADERA